MSSPDYIIITPVRNEEGRIEKTIDSVVSQTVPPAKWIIVNDGSTDNTRQIVDAAAQRHPWIQAVHREDRGFRKQGTGVIDAFYDGFSLIAPSSAVHCPPSTKNWDYLVKLDGDLSFEANYFEACFSRFAADKKLGIGGGAVWSRIGDSLINDGAKDPKFHVRGATKIYRRATWDSIGGLLRAPGWDTLDECKANMLGWRTGTFADLKVIQLKATGSADGTWKNWVKNGRANYITGYHPLFMLIKCLKRLGEKPYGIAGLGLLIGFIGGYLTGTPQVSDKSLIDYLRDQQWRRLTGKSSLWSQTRA